jgi:hypothetical protein
MMSSDDPTVEPGAPRIPRDDEHAATTDAEVPTAPSGAEDPPADPDEPMNPA